VALPLLLPPSLLPPQVDLVDVQGRPICPVPGGQCWVQVTPCIPPGLRGNRHRAFVVGIDSYRALRSLTKCRADARRMAKVLESRGYRVQLADNVDLHTLTRLFEEFLDGLFPGCTVVVFFSGHGVQGSQDSFLVAADGPGPGTPPLKPLLGPWGLL
jgi:hypothetical protein